MIIFIIIIIIFGCLSIGGISYFVYSIYISPQVNQSDQSDQSDQYNNSTAKNNNNPLLNNPSHTITTQLNTSQTTQPNITQPNITQPNLSYVLFDDWKCINNLALNLTTNGDTACLSDDGINCKVFNSNDECNKTIKNNNIIQNANYLACGYDLFKKQGITGYNASNHWCQTDPKLLPKSKNPKETSAPVPPDDQSVGWNCVGSVAFNYSTDNSLSCLAGDNIKNNCKAFNSYDDCQKYIHSYQGIFDAPYITCMERWDNAEFCYDPNFNPNSIVKTVNKNQQSDPSYGSPEWTCVNNMALNLTRDGNVACLTNDGINCKKFSSDDDCNKSILDKNTINKSGYIACGFDLFKKQGITGYNTLNHWCQTDPKLLPKSKNPKETSAPMPKNDHEVGWNCVGNTAYNYSMDNPSVISCLSNDNTKSNCKRFMDYNGCQQYIHSYQGIFDAPYITCKEKDDVYCHDSNFNPNSIVKTVNKNELS